MEFVFTLKGIPWPIWIFKNIHTWNFLGHKPFLICWIQDIDFLKEYKNNL